MTTHKLDCEAVERLAYDVGCAVRNHYMRRQISPASIYESLNALAGIAAQIIMGARDSGQERPVGTFFLMALATQLSEQSKREETLQ